MYRIIPASKCSYITNKYIAGSACEESNVGQAGTLDLFKLYNETRLAGVTGSITELSRILVQFDYENPIQESGIDFTDPSFECFVNLKDVYGGQTTPRNYQLNLYPLAKFWNEGAGSDVVAFRDLDAVNFLTASIINGSGTLWDEPGANLSGSFGDTGVDYYSTLFASQSFGRGDENLEINVTELVSASLAGLYENNGFRISFSEELEQDENTYFVKRFGSRHVMNKSLVPQMIIKCDDKIQDDTGIAYFGQNLNLFTYNIINNEYTNFLSGSVEITGSNSIVLELIASRSVKFLTSSFSISHDQIITHITSGVDYYSISFSGSQFTQFGNAQTGIYTAQVNIPIDQSLIDFLSGSTEYEFEANWKSLDSSTTFAKNWINFSIPQGGSSNIQPRNWVVNITNLKNLYSTSNGKTRLRVFVYDYDQEQYKISSKVPKRAKSIIIKNMQWRLRTAYDNTIVIPFDEATTMSYDEDGMYFDLYVEDLNVGEVYNIDIKINTETGHSRIIQNEGFKFKVTR